VRQALFTGWDADGGYTEYAVVDEQYAYRIPDVFSDLEAAPLLCAASSAIALSGGRACGQAAGSASTASAVRRIWTAQVALYQGATVHG